MRLKQLDVLRAIAILLVLGVHLPVKIINVDESFRQFMSLFIHTGWIGVDLFFVLSGFLVSGLLFREYTSYKTVKLGRFFVRRGFKIYPSFYVFLILGAILSPLITGEYITLWQFFCEAIYIQNYADSFWVFTWSLAVEEHFYLFIGILLYFCAKSKKEDPFKILIPLTITCSIFILVLRMITVLNSTFTFKTHLFATHLRIDSLLFGVLLSYYYHFREAQLRSFAIKYKNWIAILSSLFVLPSIHFYVHSFFMNTIGLTLLYLGFSGFLILSLYFSDTFLEKYKRTTDVLARIGFYSYSIYLWHVPASHWMTAILKDHLHLQLPNSVVVITYLSLAIGLGILMAKIVEVPALKFRDRKFPSRSGSLKTS